jgi:hypothetical protein
MKISSWMETQRGRVGMWVALGPLLIIATLISALVRVGAFGFVSACATLISFLLAWKGKLVGALAGVLLTGLVLIFSSHAAGDPGWWHVVFVCTLLSSLIITALSLSEGEADIVQNEERLVAKMQEMEEKNAAHMKGHLQEQIDQEQRSEALNLELKRLLEEVESYKRLVSASGEEAEKYYQQNVDLQERVLTLHRRDREMEESGEEVAKMRDENHALRQELNHFRVQHFQKDLLAEHYEERIYAHNEKLKNQRELSPETVETLEDLQANRQDAKGEYELLVADYKEVAEKLFDEQSDELKETLSTKREELSALRERIFRLEGEMLKTQQQLGSSAISPEEGYLAIADGECHRLEEENRFLLKLISRKEKTE